MKVFSIIAKLIAVASAVIGGIYVLATYGDKIVAWCKNVIDSLPECCLCDDDDEVEVEIEVDEEPEAIEVVEEVADVEEPVVDAVEEIVEEVVEAADTVVADDADFVG
jgi:hypothetical protein